MFKNIKKLLKKFWIFRTTWNYLKRFRRRFKNRKRNIKRYNGAVIQLLPTYERNDAVGNMVFEISNSLFNNLIENYIVSENVINNNNCFDLTSFKFRKDDIVIYHMSIGSRCSKVFKDIHVAKKIMVYHNITPPSFFANDPSLKSLCELGRRQVKQLYKTPDLTICVSEYNANELKSLNYKNIKVIPCVNRVDNLLKFKQINSNNHNKILTFMSVGRIEVNKCIEDVIKLFYFYNKNYKNSRLILIGKISNKEYYKKLDLLIKKLNIKKSVKFLGLVEEEELAKYYNTSDGYICMSEHEGFCVPLIEAMAFELPIFAFNSSAIPYTLSGTGVLFETKNHKENAKTMNEFLNDSVKINSIKQGERERYKYFSNSKILNEYIKAIDCKNKSNDLKTLLNIYNLALEIHKNNNSISVFPHSFYEFYQKYKFDNDMQKKLIRIKCFFKYRKPKFYNLVKLIFKGKKDE